MPTILIAIAIAVAVAIAVAIAVAVAVAVALATAVMHVAAPTRFQKKMGFATTAAKRGT